MAGNSITTGPSRVPAPDTTSTAAASGSTAPPQTTAVSIGKPAENPKEPPTLRTLPDDVKRAILRQAHPQQSTTALAAGLFARTVDTNERALDQQTVIKERGKEYSAPAMSMDVTKMAKMIAKNPQPNWQRDQFKAGRGRMHNPAGLHEDIDLRDHSSHLFAANVFEMEQANVLLHTDFGKLERLGERTTKQDIVEIQADIGHAAWDANPNSHSDSAPSTSAVCDALGIGLAVRLREIKNDDAQLYAIQFLQAQIKDRDGQSVGRGPMLPTGASKNARMDMLFGMLKATGHLTSAPGQSAILKSTLSALSRSSWDNAAKFSVEDQRDIAIAFGKAVPAFTRAKTGTGDDRHEISHKAMTEFRGLINGRPVFDKDYESSGDTVKFARHVRAQIIGEVAASLAENLAEKPARAGANAAGNRAMKKMRPLLDSVRTVFTGRTPVQTSMLNHMLDSLKLPPRKKDTLGQNLFAGVENSAAWTGLLEVAPQLNESDQRKIGNAFLKQIEESRLLDLPPHEFDLATSYQQILLGAPLKVGGVSFVLSCGDRADPEMASLYCDYGVVPKSGDTKDLYRALLMANMTLHPATGQAMMIAPQTNHILLGQDFKPKTMKPNALQHMMETLAQGALKWQAGA